MTENFEPPLSPFSLFHKWQEEAARSEPSDPDAACLATVDPTGLPNARIILVRKVNSDGFYFFTNYESTKGKELTASSKAALNYHWKTTRRQVRIRGTVSLLSAEESDSYYQSRPLGNRIGAWASLQSTPLPDKEILLHRVRAFEEKYAENPPRPPHWGGYLLRPETIEFWQEGAARLHDRVCYTKTEDKTAYIWVPTRLYP